VKLREAFSQVVQQEPEEGEAWANIAATHMPKQKPAKAYPALAEALKQNRNTWPVWWSKLFVCLDLPMYDEAIHFSRNQECIFCEGYPSSEKRSDCIIE